MLLVVVLLHHYSRLANIGCAPKQHFLCVSSVLQARCTVKYLYYIDSSSRPNFLSIIFTKKTCRIYPLIGDMRWPVVRDLQQYSRAPRIADQRNNTGYNDTFLITGIITTSLDMSAVSCAVCRDFIVTWRTHRSHRLCSKATLLHELDICRYVGMYVCLKLRLESPVVVESRVTFIRHHPTCTQLTEV